jgi:acetyl-CoA carboxylase biotin carboxyl carrier protein
MRLRMDNAQLEAIRSLLAIADHYHLRELVVEENGVRVTIRTATALPLAEPALSPTTGPSEPESQNGSEFDEEADNGAYHRLRSPMTGIFYRSPSPDSPPFVVEGQNVDVGQTVGLIEAMKVFSEIPADTPGRVIRVLAETGQLLQEGDSLMLLDTLVE